MNEFIDNQDGTIYIILTQGKVAIIDSNIHHLIRKYRWIVSRQPKNRFYAYAHLGKNNNLIMHRFISSAKKGVQINHINGNTLDNRICNLRLSTTYQNQRFASWSTNTSGHKGVTFSVRDKTWIAQAHIKGHRVVILRSKDKNLCVNCYKKFMQEHPPFYEQKYI
jgi:hypothetical protein